jgi:hypothetical protein
VKDIVRLYIARDNIDNIETIRRATKNKSTARRMEI